MQIPPHNLEAEQSVLGSIFFENQCIPKISTIIKPSDFYREDHRIIFEAISQLEVVDIITLSDALRESGKLKLIGGTTYLATLANLVPTAANVEHYARIVKELSVRREIIRKARKVIDQAYEGGFEDIDSFLSFAQREVCSVSGFKTSEGLSHIREIITQGIDEISSRKHNQGVIGIATGYTDLDKFTAGWQQKNLIILAARPSMGKTSFTVQSGAYAATIHSKKVALFSLEMSKKSLLQKLLCNQGMIDGNKIRLGDLKDEDWEKIIEVGKMLYRSGLYIDDSKKLTVLDIKARCRRMKQEAGLDLIIIDYLQLITPHTKKQSMTYDVGEISKELKNMADELDVPVICLSQLSRQCEQRGRDKRPILSDLRDSGSIEADADMVMFLYRDEYYNPESEKKGITEVNIAKQREGPTGMIDLGFFKEYTRFVNLAQKAN